MSSAIAGLYGAVDRALREAVEVRETLEEHGQLRVNVPPAQRVEALTVLKGLGFTHYIFCCAVDYPDDNRIAVLDHVYSIQRRARVTLQCDVSRDEPRLPTATALYAGSDWHERETWELFGVVFAGHPRLTRLLLPDWFEGFPMRRDVALAARVEKPWPGESFKPE